MVDAIKNKRKKGAAIVAMFERGELDIDVDTAKTYERWSKRFILENDAPSK